MWKGKIQMTRPNDKAVEKAEKILDSYFIPERFEMILKKEIAKALTQAREEGYEEAVKEIESLKSKLEKAIDYLKKIEAEIGELGYDKDSYIATVFNIAKQTISEIEEKERR